MLPGMISDSDLSRATLERFRSEAASQQPMPAGVAIAAVSAGFAIALVAKALAVTGRRNAAEGTAASTKSVAPAENATRLASLAAAAQASSQHLLQLASDDIAAFEAYLTARRLPHLTGSESEARQHAIDSAVRRAIDLPLEAAQEAATGLQLCGEVSTFSPVELAADLGVTAGLLASALRGFLLCAQSNVRLLPLEAASLRERVATEAQRHTQALRLAEKVLERARIGVESALVIPRTQP